jgi:hypothetical protein
MDTILVVNARSSRVKFQVFATDGTNKLDRLIKGQIEGIATRPRLRTHGVDGALLIDQSYTAGEVSDPRAAIEVGGAWLRELQKLFPSRWGIASSTAAPNTTGRSSSTTICSTISKATATGAELVRSIRSCPALMIVLANNGAAQRMPLQYLMSVRACRRSAAITTTVATSPAASKGR